MPLRNPFKRSPLDISLPSLSLSTTTTSSSASIPPSPEPIEFQLSEIDDNGTFLPPSPPPTKPSFWSTKSTASFNSHVTLSTEPFSMSRESFDSYRRSFDISARSPVSPSLHTRLSLDNELFVAPLPTLESSEVIDDEDEDIVEEEEVQNAPQRAQREEFEEVVLDDRKQESQKKKGLFGREGASKGLSWQLFVGRKRAESGAEMEGWKRELAGLGGMKVPVER